MLYNKIMSPNNYGKIHKILEESADRIFAVCNKDGDYFLSLNFEVKVEADSGGFETIVTHRSKKGFFEENEQQTPS